MAKILVAGTIVEIGSTYGTQFTISAISNANPAVATLSPSHGVTVGDSIVISSGWGLLNTRVARVSAVSTNDVTLEGIDTTNTVKYPVGGGTGTGREVLTWTQVTQLKKDIGSSGGDQKFTDTTELSDLDESQVPTTKGPITITFNFYSDPALPWLTVVRAAEGIPTPVRFLYSNGGGRQLANAYWSLRETPTPVADLWSGLLTLSYTKPPVVYAT